MTLVVPNTADILMLQYILNRTITLHLFTNNLTPGKSTALSDITESTDAGYASISLPDSGWSYATTLGVSAATYAQQTFTITVGTSIYGYYLTSTDGLLWVERFPTAPYVLPNTDPGGGEILVTPTFNLN